MKFADALTSIPSSSVQFTKWYPGSAVAFEPAASPVAGANVSPDELTVPISVSADT
ncbi:hypothetical protein SDC9_49122 [bioreactor metagenome]|uniref:Uncharacterized protein n=1 Tax=bioreactor metagenome TaxID=1076179 RepID=A0A644WH14_9ZZZZ